MTTAITNRPDTAIEAHGFNREAIQVIKDTVAKGATDAELFMFLELAKRYDLDPFAKEIWCVRMGSGMTITVSRDGYLKAAMKDPNFDGLQSFVVKEGDEFEFDPVTSAVVHKFGKTRGKILGAWALCHHKSRRPVACFVDFDEYKGSSPIWGKYPSAMIQKVAEVFVLKRQFGINGLVAKEEIDYQEREEVVVPTITTTTVHAEVVSDWSPSEAQRKRLFAIGKASGLNAEDVKGVMVDHGFGASTTGLSRQQYDALCDEILPRIGQQAAAMEAQAAVAGLDSALNNFTEFPAEMG